MYGAGTCTEATPPQYAALLTILPYSLLEIELPTHWTQGRLTFTAAHGRLRARSPVVRLLRGHHTYLHC